MTSTMRIARFLAGAALLPTLAAAEMQTVRGLLRAPVGVDPSKLSVVVYDVGPVECENDWNPLAPIAVNEKGEFSATWDAKAETQFEVFGPGVRRARFQWPAEVAGDENARATFALEGGWSIDGVVVDGTTGAPLANVLVGPVAPGTDANEVAMEKSFPFFTRTDAEGRFALEGLASPTSWEIPFFAEGHVRQRLQTVPGSPMRVELAPGGRFVAGGLAGSRTAAPMASRTVLLTGGPRHLHIIRRTDEKGEFRFDGLAAGEYDIAAWSQSSGAGPIQRLLITDHADIEGLVVFWPEGIRIAGTARDRETGDPVVGASLTLRGWSLLTDAEGRFEFPLVEAPWPVTIAGEHPEFELRTDDQPTDRWPINGSDAVDIADVEIQMRRKRALEVTLAVEPPPVEGEEELAGVLELHGPPVAGAKLAVARHRIVAGKTIIPLESAGTRVAFMRTADGRATQIEYVGTDVRQTTSTLELTLATGGALEGSFRYEAEDPPRAPVAPEFKARLEAPFSWTEGDARVEIAVATPTADGAFAMKGLPPGEFRLVLARPEGEPWLEETVVVERGATLAFDRTVSRGVLVAGTVTDEEGSPLREVTVSAYGSDTGGGSLHLRSVSDAEGKFRFEGFAGPALKEISASHAIHGNGSVGNIAVPDENIALQMKKPAGIVATLAPGYQAPEAFLLVGMLRPASDGSAQWFYEVETRAPFAGESSTTLRPRSSNRIRVAAGNADAWDVSPPFEWSPTGEQKEVVLQPSASSALEVDVVGTAPEDLSLIEATLINTSIPESLARLEFDRPTVTGGKLVFSTIPAGEYMLLALGPGGESAVVDNIDIARGQTARVTMSIAAPDVELAGRATTTDGDPVADAEVRLRFAGVPEAEVLLEARTGDNGAFSLFPLEAGKSYMVEIGDAPMAHSWTLDIPFGSEKVVRREFSMSVAVEATLSWPDSLAAKLASGMPVILRNAAANRSEILHKPLSGEATVLFPGRYEVSVGEERVGFAEVPAQGGTARVIQE